MTEQELLDHIKQDDEMMLILEAIAELGLNDSWLAAGVIRNFIWNTLSGRPAFDPTTDIDVVFFDEVISCDESLAIEEELKKVYPKYDWQVRNQKAMHVHSPNTKPYANSRDAISKYPETATAIAVRKVQDELELFAPYGLEDVSSFTLRPTPHFSADDERIQVYRRRLSKKDWFGKWPELTVKEK